jgi:23S rRNA pseudouridine1911/1915/1917 synthase
MKNKEILQFDEDEIIRLDSFLASRLSQLSRSYIKQVIKKGDVSVDGKIKKPSFILDKPCKIEISFNKTSPAKKEFEKNIIYEDKHLIIFCKPAGLLMHPKSPAWEQNPEIACLDEQTVVSMLVTARRKEVLSKGVVRCGLVHRLDRGTSGVMVIAKTAAAQENISNQFKDRLVDKTYTAVCSGNIETDKGIIDTPIGRVAGGKIKASPVGRPSVTEYKILKRAKDYVWVKLHPKTGRTNQLRVHMSWLKCPILGDDVYNGKPYDRLMLHAETLTFKHPVGNKKVNFKCQCPKEFTDFWKKLKK